MAFFFTSLRIHFGLKYLQNISHVFIAKEYSFMILFWNHLQSVFSYKILIDFKSAKSTMQLSMLLHNNWVIFWNIFFKEPMNLWLYQKQTNEPDKKPPRVKRNKLLVKECLDNLTKMKDRLKGWMLMHVTCIESCMETKIYGSW